MDASHLNPEGMKRRSSLRKSEIQLSNILALFRTFHCSLPRRVTFTSFLTLPVAPSWAGFTHFLLDHTYLHLSCTLLLHLGPLPGTTHFILKMEAASSSETLVSYHNAT